MKYSRRSFLKLTTAGVAIGAFSGGLLSCSAAAKSGGNLNRFGIQLYSLRDVIGKDPKAVITEVADMGFREIESFEGPQGMFWGMKNTEFGNFLSGLGMKAVSSHTGLSDLDRKAADAAEIGMQYLIMPYVGPRKTADAFKKVADMLNKSGETCRKHGIKFGYHNHDYSFKPVEGQLPQDIMMQNTDPELVDFEMDIYWVVAANQDPIAWFQKYPGRFRLCHVKDRAKNAPKDGENHSCIIGTGDIDFASILKAGKAAGLQHYIYEQEAYEDAPPQEAARASAAYLKTLKI